MAKTGTPREDVDMIAKTITINLRTRNKQTTFSRR